MSPLQSPSPLLEPKSQLAEQKIDEYFSMASSHGKYTDKEIEDVSELLQNTNHPSWHTVPRLYIVLRTIGKLELLDSLIEDKITDFWFPFPGNVSRHHVLSTPEFLKTQAIVLTKVTTLEKGKHRHLDEDAEMPFKDVEELGNGSYGVVQKVSSVIQVFARKTIWRRSSFLEQQENMTSFKQEVDALRRLEHHHIVKLEGSYTDSVRAAFFMSPVADCNLAEYFLSTQKSTGSDSIERKDHLRTFFGCLTHALAYVHRAKVRHKDIKPRNILVCGSKVLLADFGISRDWNGMSRSATTGQVIGSPEYRSPEAARHIKRNSSSDIWSLGCVFLEIVTVLKGERVEDLKSSMKAESESPLYWCNLVTIAKWIRHLRGRRPESDSIPLEWVEKMLQEKPAARCRALDLRNEVLKVNSSSDTRFTFCGSCCSGEDWVNVERADVPPEV